MKIDWLNIPFMMVKSDWWFTYDSTDIAALYYRTQVLKRNWIIYVIWLE